MNQREWHYCAAVPLRI